MQNIVTIIGKPMHEENAWQCNNEREAANMVNWLKEQGIPARATSLMIWQALADKWKRDNE
jgi:hypothetical protein